MTTDIPITYVEKEIFFFIDRPLTIVLGPDETLEQSPSKTGDDFFQPNNEILAKLVQKTIYTF